MSSRDPRAGTKRPCYAGCGQRAKQGQLGFCGPRCRFLARVDRSAGDDGCWPWLGPPLNSKGYGRFDADGKRYLAHRCAHELFTGPIPDGYEVDHVCRNTMCVNPRHLEAVTPEEHDRRTPLGAFQKAKTHCPKGHEYNAENTRISKSGSRHCRRCGSPGWGLKGTRNAHAKLTESVVAEARRRRVDGERVDDLAEFYGVAQSVMSRALTGVTWSHVA